MSCIRQNILYQLKHDLEFFKEINYIDLSLKILVMLLFGIGIFVFGIILAINQISAQVYENQSILCIPNLNSNTDSRNRRIIRSRRKA